MVAGGTYALTRRTCFRKAFLGPWHPLVADIWLYSMGYWARELEVTLHHTMRCVTHGHTTVTPTWDNLPKFTAAVYEDVSKALGELMRACRYEAPGNVFEDRQPFQMRLVDAEAQASHLVYERVNGVAAGLVRRPQDLPGETFDFGLWKGAPVVVERPPLYFAKRRPKQQEVYFAPPAQLYLAFGGDLEALVHHMRRLESGAVRELNRARRGPVLGAKELRRIHPYNEPRSPREPKGQRVPSFKVGARGVSGRVRRLQACREVRWFRAQHKACQAERAQGGDPLYPAGTYQMRVQHGARVAEPEPDAILTAPELTLAEVKQRLAEGAQARALLTKVPDELVPDGEARSEEAEADDGPAHRALARRVREAFAAEAAEVVEGDRLEFVKAGAPAGGSGGGEGGERPEVEVQHLGQTRRSSTAARVVVLRDQRRGRPPRTQGTGPPR